MTTQAYMGELKIENVPLDYAAFRERFLFGGPSGYKNFRLLVPGDYEYRYAKIKVEAVAGANTVPRVNGVKLFADMPDIRDRGRPAITAAVTTFYFNRVFTVPPEVNAVQVGGSVVGIVDVTNVTATSFDAGLYDLSETLMAGVISWIAHGY